MSNTITPEERQGWISKYKKAHDKLDRLCAALAFLSCITDADCSQRLELDADQRTGLSSLLSILTDQLADNFYERLPYPDDFAELCKGGQGND